MWEIRAVSVNLEEARGGPRCIFSFWTTYGEGREGEGKAQGLIKLTVEKRCSGVYSVIGVGAC